MAGMSIYSLLVKSLDGRWALVGTAERQLTCVQNDHSVFSFGKSYSCLDVFVCV